MHLENVKKGDFLAVYCGGGWDGPDLRKAPVTKATKTKVEAAGFTFNRYGRVRGGSTWDRTRAEPWNEEKHAAEHFQRMQEREHRIRCNSLSGISWRELPMETVKQVHELVSKVNNSKAKP